MDLERDSVQGHFLLGVALARNEQWQIACDVFTTCLQLEPNHLKAHQELAAAYAELGQDDKAREHKQRATGLASSVDIRQQLSEQLNG